MTMKERLTPGLLSNMLDRNPEIALCSGSFKLENDCCCPLTLFYIDKKKNKDFKEQDVVDFCYASFGTAYTDAFWRHFDSNSLYGLDDDVSEDFRKCSTRTLSWAIGALDGFACRQYKEKNSAS